MIAKTIREKSTKEIRSALAKSNADGFSPTITLIFISVKQDRKAVCELLDADNIDVLGSTSCLGIYQWSSVRRRNCTVAFSNYQKNATAYSLGMSLMLGQSAVKEQQIGIEKTLTGQNNYKPTVSITTKKADNQIKIKVSDNGNGIPKDIINKIFQPFFTTKPTGQETGLGLSLSYDIVRMTGGEITLETFEGKGSTFTVTLPSN